MSSIRQSAASDWTSSSDLKAQVLKWWQSGELLNELTASERSFPRKLKFKAPTSSEISDHFDDVRRWIISLTGKSGNIADKSYFRLEMREVKHKVFGRNQLPAEAWIDSIEDAFALIGKKKEVAQYMRIYETTVVREPQLAEWLKQRPLRALELNVHWENCLSVVGWFKSHQKPSIYLRQIDIPGIHSKFIESHRAVLAELLDMVLPADAIQHEKVGSKDFAQRYHLLDKPLRIRFRFLDAKLTAAHNLPHVKGQDITLDSESFFALRPKVKQVFITENEINFLSFPELSDSLVMFGSGYGLTAILQANWLMHCKVFYWGDIDTHGFAILSEARNAIPHLKSLMMDEETLTHHLDRCSDDTQHKADYLPHLTTEEQRVYKQLKNNTWGSNLRLEQELIGWNYACDSIRKSTSTAEASKLDSRNLTLKVSDTDLSNYLSPSKCGLRVYFDHNGKIERTDVPSTEFRQRLGQEHKNNHLTQLLNRIPEQKRVDLRGTSEETRIAATTKSVVDAEAAVIIQPLLQASTNLAGIDCLIQCAPHAFIMRDGQYVIRQFAITRRVDTSVRSEVILKLELFGWLFATLFGHEPLLEIQTGNNETVQIPSDGGRAALKIMHEVLEFKQLLTQPYSPVGTTKCGACNYKSHCWTAAEDSRDIATLVGVNQKLALELHKAGVRTIDSLYADFNEHQLAAVEISETPQRQQQQQVGKRAGVILRMAESRLKNEPVVLQRPTLPTAECFVVIDFEGVPPLVDGAGQVYLWGAQFFGAQLVPDEYRPFICDTNDDQDHLAWKVFLTFCFSVFDKFGDIPFLHWHHYERSKIVAYMEKYGDINGTATRLLSNLLDLHELTRNSLALPLSSYSLKSVEKFVGYQRSQAEYGGLWSVEKYLQAFKQENKEARTKLIDEILLYNKEDLEATWSIFRWLKEYFANTSD